jgi:hypothetical protein
MKNMLIYSSIREKKRIRKNDKDKIRAKYVMYEIRIRI